MQSGSQVFGHRRAGQACVGVVIWGVTGISARSTTSALPKLRARSSPSWAACPARVPVIGLSQPTSLPAKNPTATTHSSRMATIDGKASTYSTTQNTTAAALPPARLCSDARPLLCAAGHGLVRPAARRTPRLRRPPGSLANRPRALTIALLVTNDTSKHSFSARSFVRLFKCFGAAVMTREELQ